MRDHDNLHQDARSGPVGAGAGADLGSSEPRTAEGERDVMSILEDVERQFDRLREFQATHSEELAGIAKRASALDERQGRLEALEGQLDARRQEIERHLSEQLDALARAEQEVKHAAAERQSALARERTDLDRRSAEVQSAQKTLEDERAAIEARRRELVQARSTLDEQRADLERRVSELGDVQGKLADAQKRCERAEANVGDLIRQLEESSTQLEDATARRSAIEARVAMLQDEVIRTRQESERTETEAMELVQEAEGQRDAVTAELEELRARHQALTRQLEHAAAEQESLQMRLEESRKQLQRSRLELESTTEQLQFRREQIDQLNHQLAQREQELQSRSGELEERDRRIADIEQQLAEGQRKLEIAGQKLGKFSRLLSEQGPQVEQGAAALAMLEQQKQQIERLTREVAEARRSGDPEEVQRRDERIQELTDALKQSRGQTVGQPDAFALEHRNSELQQQLDEFKVELERAHLAAAEAQRQLQEHVDRATARDQAARRFEVERDELTERIGGLEEQLAEALASADAAQEAAMAASASAASASAAGAGAAEAAEQVEALRIEARRLEAEAQRLAERERSVQRAAEEVERQSKLQPRPSESEDDVEREEEARRLQHERTRLEEVRRALVNSERRMLRRWARSRAVVLVGSLLLLLGVNAGGAWFAAGRLFPAQVVATLTLAAESASPDPLEEPGLGRWQRWHTDLIYNEFFSETVANRMADLRLDAWRTPAEVSGLILEDLAVDAGKPGLLTLSLVRHDREEAMLLLDVIGSALASESKRQMEERGHSACATILGERTEGGRVRYASVGPIAIEDTQLVKAVPIFCGCAVVSFMLIGVLYSRLVRTRRVLDEDQDLFASLEEIEQQQTQTLREVTLHG